MSKNYAIIIGVNQYQFLQSLTYAVKDAELMREFLQTEGQFDKLFFFSDTSDPVNGRSTRPNRQNVRRLLNTMFETPFLEAPDNFWFFFSGHGIHDQGYDYLMLEDGDPRDIKESSLALSYVTERLKRCGAGNIILILDACRSNQGKKDGLGVGKEEQKGVITFFSCSPEQVSYEIPELQQGVFTTAVLEGLGTQGKCATVERLDEYLLRRVPELLQQHGKSGTQTPYTVVEPRHKSHLILLPKYATTADITLLKYDASLAEIERDYQKAEQLWCRVLAASQGRDRDAIRALGRLPSPDRGVGVPGVKESLFWDKLPVFSFQTVTVNRKGEIVKQDTKEAKYFTEDLGNGVKLEMVYIPGGEFLMGSLEGEEGEHESQKPQHLVKVKPFFMSKYPITQEQWEIIAREPKKQKDLNPDSSYFKGKKRPVERVNWYETIEWCARLSTKTEKQYRLPSEAQWEYGCRAGTTTPFYFGETLTPDITNYNGNYTYGEGPKGKYRKKTTEVGIFPPNGLGLYDMHGNVWEWCLDPWHDNYEGELSDERVWDEDNNENYYQNPTDNNFLVNILNDKRRRVLRGGSWFLDPVSCRAACRARLSPDARVTVNDGFGFRVVCSFVVTWS